MRVPLLGVIVLVLATAAGCGHPSAPPETAKPSAAGPKQMLPEQPPQEAAVGKPAPDFSFTTVDGKSVKLSDLKGKPVVVNFWASWCHFCAQEAPDLEATYNQYKSQGLQMLGVGADPNDSPDVLKKKAAELKLTYPVGPDADAAKAYGVTGFPTTFFVDSKGVLVSQLVGAQPKDQIQAEVKKIL